MASRNSIIDEIEQEFGPAKTSSAGVLVDKENVDERHSYHMNATETAEFDRVLRSDVLQPYPTSCHLLIFPVDWHQYTACAP